MNKLIFTTALFLLTFAYNASAQMYQVKPISDLILADGDVTYIVSIAKEYNKNTQTKEDKLHLTIDGNGSSDETATLGYYPTHIIERGFNVRCICSIEITDLKFIDGNIVAKYDIDGEYYQTVWYKWDGESFVYNETYPLN